jgi:murein DD-endopeptidase MepM/ murein hydrolase activator NlpD
VKDRRPRARARALFIAGLLSPLFSGAARSAPAASGFVLTGAIEQGGLLRGIAPAGTLRLTLDGKPVPLDASRQFLLGFDRDQPGHALLVAERAGGEAVREDLVIASRKWQIENVDVARRPEGSTTEEYLRRRAEETRRIEAARAVVTGASGWSQHFIRPAGGRISGVFGSQRVYRGEPGSFHSGLDLAAGAGAPVVAPADGVVVLAGPPAFSLEGNLVIIDHGMGLSSAFLHLATQTVRVGDSVHQGQQIGTVGATGRATGPHLHWSVKWQQARVDPQRLLDR